jgi:4'-phosphopantetheinyl transferase
MRGEVHIWRVHMDIPSAMAARVYTVLSEDERERLARLASERDQQRFIVAHGALRDVLARYLEVTPSRVEYVHNPSGKPALDPGFGSPLRFNLSHSGALALIAIAMDADVGVDVECVRAHRDYSEIARWFFSATEAEYLASVPYAEHAEAFIRCWTLKEAFLKARGDGLTAVLDGLPLTFTTGAAEDAVELQSPASGRWSIHTLRPAPGYIGALAVEGGDWRVTESKWEMPRD